MNKETEALRRTLSNIDLSGDCTECDYYDGCAERTKDFTLDAYDNPCPYWLDLILKACKEKGLRFVDPEEMVTSYTLTQLTTEIDIE